MIVKKLVFLLVIGVALAALPVWAEEGKLIGNTLGINKMTCKQLMSGNDIEREVGIAFFHGYMAGKKDRQIIDLPAASVLSDKVRDYCLSNPTGTVMEAFKKSDK